MIKEGFKKVSESGGCYVTARFFNPETGEEYSSCVRDYDNSDGSRDDDEAYYAPIDEEALKLWKRKHGIVSVGDCVKVVRGRKLPIGRIGIVTRIYDWKDMYGRVQTRYCEFSDGYGETLRTSLANVELI